MPAAALGQEGWLGPGRCDREEALGRDPHDEQQNSWSSAEQRRESALPQEARSQHYRGAGRRVGWGDEWGGAVPRCQAAGSGTSILGQSLKKQPCPQAPGPPGRIHFFFPTCFTICLLGSAPCPAPWGVWRTHHPGSDIKWQRTKAGRASSIAVGLRSFHDSKVRGTWAALICSIK